MGNYKKYIAILIIFCMQFTTYSVAYASTTVGGWNIGSAVAQGATTVFTAVKNGATAVAKIRPTPEQIARGVLRGAMGGLLLSVAADLIEDGVDFVLDPKNNSLQYKPKVCSDTSCPYFYYNGNDGVKYTSSASAAEAMFKVLQKGNSSLSSYKFYQTVTTNGRVIDYYTGFFGSSIKNDSYIQIVVVKNSSYDEKNTKSIPLTQIASQAIDAADQGNKDAQALTTAVAQTATATNTDDQIVPAAQLTQALDASAPSKPDDDAKSPTTNPTNSNTQTQDQTQDQTASSPASAPTASPMPSDIPKDCAFFNTACVWFDWAKTQYNTAKTAITDTQTAITDYFKTDPSENDNIDIDKQDETKKPDTNLNFNGSCPSDITLIDSDFLGLPLHWAFEFSDFCMILSKYVRPILILSGSFSALLIMGGRKDG